MKIIFSFFLSLFIYVVLISFFLYMIIINNKQPKVEKVYIHQAILVSKKQKHIIPKIEKHINKIAPKKSSIKPQKHIKSNTTFSKGGKNIPLNQLFSTVKENIATTKIKQKKQMQMTKNIGASISKSVLKELSKLQSQVAVTNLEGSKKDSSFISNSFAKIWAQMNTTPGDFVKLQVNISNGNINLSVIATNLDTIRLNKFLNKLKSININKIKSLDIIIEFNVKLKENK